ncbi:hypothetical protein C2S52_015383 [Perilla frutescens var. hirtella]|nr:hypothetical protein C2S52_015383 [Perilla frutescens var. hirtella]
MMKMDATDRRFDRRLPMEGRASVSLQRKLVETRQATNQMPDLTDFMNDAFFGTVNGYGGDEKKGYNLTGGGGRTVRDRRDDDFDSSTRSVSSRQTQDWLEEAKRMMASSPTRGTEPHSPSRLVSSPRFAMSQGRLSTSSVDSKRDPFSRSARRHRTPEGISGEILSRTAAAAANHTRNRSESNFNLDPPQSEPSSPASEIQKWISNNLKLPNTLDPTISPDPTPPSPTSHLGAPPLPPRQSFHRRTRFQTDPRSPLSQPITSPTNPPANSISKRTFKSTASNSNAPNTIFEDQLLSPPKLLVESAHRRSLSSSTCSVPEAGILSPPRNLVESAHRRSISSSTCRNDKILQKDNADHDLQLKKGGLKDQESNNFSRDQDFNSFLKEQRVKIEMLMNGEINGRAKIVLSGPSNSTSSMVAATCYAWLLENKNRANKKEGARNENVFEFVVPVMNIRRGKMWKQRQAAWLFHHAGLDAASLVFSNEVDLETLMMEKQLSMLVVGEDILKTNGEVGSACTVLTDNYCEDAYDLLQTPILKKLMMAGILLDTQNLSPSPKLSMTRDAEAVQLLSVASAPNYRNTLFDQLIQDHKEANFYEVLCRTYGKPLSDIDWDNNAAATGRRTSEKISPNAVSDDKKQNGTNDTRAKKVSPISGKPTPSPVQNPIKEPVKANEANRGKKGNFFAKLFGFGSK